MKRVFYLGLVFIGLFGFFLARVYTFNQQQFISEYLNKLAGNRFEITTAQISPLRIGFTPTIEINNIYVKDKEITESDNQIFMASNVNVELSLFDIVMGKQKFNAIKLNTPVLNVVSAKAVASYIDYFKQTVNAINNITITDGKICDLVTKDCEKYISKFDLKFNHKNANRILNLSWGVLPEDKFNLTANLQKNSEISVVIEGLSGKFTVSGKLENNYLEGNLNGEIFNPKLVLSNLIKPFELPQNLNITSNKASIKVTTPILLGVDKFELSDIKFDSSDASGTGKVSYSSGESAKINVNFDKFTSLEGLTPVAEVTAAENANLDEDLKIDQQQNALPVLADKETAVSFKELVLGDKKFTDLVINYVIKDNAIYTANVEGMYNNDIKFALKNPNYDQNEKILMSDFSLEGKNLDSVLEIFMNKNALEYKDKEAGFNLTSKLKVSPTELNLNDINLNVANAVINGNLKKIFGINPEYIGNIDFSNFKFNNLYFNDAKNAIKYFCLNSYENAYLAKFKVLREFKEKIKLDIKIDNSLIDTLQVKAMDAQIAMEKGQIKVNHLVLDSDFAKIDKLLLSLNAKALNPNINLEVQASKFDMDYIKSIFGLTDENSSAVPAKIEEVKSVTPAEQIKSVWSNDSLNLFRFDKFIGSINLDINNISVNNNSFDKITLSSTLKDETLLLEPLELKWKGMDANIKGAISQDFDQTIISVNFSANNMDLASVAEVIDIKKIKGGKANLTGNIYTSGASQAALARNIQLTMPFAIRDLALESFDLENLILKSANENFISVAEVKNFLSKAFEPSNLKITKIQGQLIANKGVVESKDVNFEAPYSAGVFGGVFDLNKMIIKSQSNITFVPEQQAKPIVIAISSYGPLRKFDSVVNDDLLEKYLTSKVKAPAENQNLENNQ